GSVALRDVAEQLHQDPGEVGLATHAHAATGVEQEVEAHCPVCLIQARVKTPSTRVDAPVDVTQFVAGLVGPEVVELDALARLTAAALAALVAQSPRRQTVAVEHGA